MQLERSAGILLHLTSLPVSFDTQEQPSVGTGLRGVDFGVGDLGTSAYRFVDFLHDSGQHVWQVLPLGPTAWGDSPYSSYSAFAGNPLLISPELLVSEGVLSLAEVSEELAEAASQPSDPTRCDYARARRLKWSLIEKAHERYRVQAQCEQINEFESFCVKQRWWLDDFSLFAALRKNLGTDNWSQWESGLVRRDSRTLGEFREKLSREVELEQFAQYLFFSQWNSLRSYAAGKQVLLFGDMPIFVAYGSADVWANQSCFQLDDQGRPTRVAGVPPDYFSKTGQLWGNPLYDWETLRSKEHFWWVQRLRAAFEQFDILRIDHFRGFEAFWSVPASAKTAVSGEWVKGPGAEPFEASRSHLGELPIVAEDLGMITEEVHQLRDQLDFPGMRVLQFGFDNPDDVFHRPESYPENSVAYTGTHDNSTIMGWYREGSKNKVRCDLLEPGLEQQDDSLRIHWQLANMVYQSASKLAILPMQDLLGLDDDTRMNIPGVAEGNWQWRLAPGQLTSELAEHLKQACASSGRLVEEVALS
ncbi:MAG: 4-alpha-glucanotransferase [Pirellulaceae bacterium]